MTSHLLKTLREVLMDAVHVSFDFFKVLIPISIAMKILAELDWIRYLALPLEPVMQLTGLPADLGIAWATGIMVNFYSALIVFIGLLPGLPPLTTEQVTTLAVMMLIAHSIPGRRAHRGPVRRVVHRPGRHPARGRRHRRGHRAYVLPRSAGWIRPPASPLPLRRTSTCSGGRSGKCGTSSASSA